MFVLNIGVCVYKYMYDKFMGKFVNVFVNLGGCKGCYVV